MMVAWISSVFLIVAIASLAQRFLYSERESHSLGPVVGLLPTLSALIILIAGVVWWVRRRDRYQAMILRQRETWNCYSCGYSWMSVEGL
jgi:hypothetical protein